MFLLPADLTNAACRPRRQNGERVGVSRVGDGQEVSHNRGLSARTRRPTQRHHERVAVVIKLHGDIVHACTQDRLVRANPRDVGSHCTATEQLMRTDIHELLGLDGRELHLDDGGDAREHGILNLGRRMGSHARRGVLGRPDGEVGPHRGEWWGIQAGGNQDRAGCAGRSTPHNGCCVAVVIESHRERRAFDESQGEGGGPRQPALAMVEELRRADRHCILAILGPALDLDDVGDARLGRELAHLDHRRIRVDHAHGRRCRSRSTMS